MEVIYHTARDVPASLEQDITAAMDRAADGLSQDELLGNCPFNAVRLWSELRTHGYDVETVRGGLDIDDEPVPTDPDDLSETGLAHWWVRLHDDNTTYVLDLAAEVPDRLGQRLILTETPDEYIALETGPDESAVEMFGSR